MAQIDKISPTEAAAELAEGNVAMGYEDVANLEGGITAWMEAGLPTIEHHAEL